MTEIISETVNISREPMHTFSPYHALPKKFLDSLIERWRKLFNSMLRKDKDVRALHIQLDTDGFVNKHGVRFCTSHLSYYRDSKKFVIFVAPRTRQDILCIKRPEKQEPYIRVEESSLRSLFAKFFEEINQVRFCAECGNFCSEANYYIEHDMCETCLFEELACAGRKEVQICTICQEGMKRWYKTECGHFFHRKCLASLKPKNEIPCCPNCRAALDPVDQSFLDSHMESADETE